MVMVVKEVENKFLNRKELLLKFSHKNAPTPSKEEIKKQVMKEYKADEDNVDIRYIASKKNTNYSFAKIFLKEVEKEKKQTREKQPEEVKKS